MAQRKTLTERQVEILRWISDGCRDGVMEGDSHRVSAAALRRRGLVRTSGKGPAWSALVTEAGQEYLDQVDGDDPPIAREANKSVPQRLVDDVIAAGGAMRVPRRPWPAEEASVDYRNRVLLAERYGKVPAGKRFEIATISDTELEVRLVEDPGNLGRPDLVEVEVPEKVASYHKAARRFRDDKPSHQVSRTQLGRAVLIIHAFATEAERRGWPVGAGEDSSRLMVTVSDRTFWIDLSEKGVKERARWEREVEASSNAFRYWSARGEGDRYPSGPYDKDGTGALSLHLGSQNDRFFQGHQSNWGDRVSWRLESRLPHVFREIEERVAKADRIEEEERVAARDRAEKEREAAKERERQWHLLMGQAREKLAETQRAALLRSQEQAWREAKRLLEYCEAMEVAHGTGSESAGWIAWAKGFATKLNPLSEPLVMPDPPEETPEALQEHLPAGWSVRGPEYAPPSPPSAYSQSVAVPYRPDLHRHPFRSAYSHFHR